MSSIHDFIGRSAIKLLSDKEREWWGGEIENLPQLCFLPDHHLDAQNDLEKEKQMRPFCCMPGNVPIPHTPSDRNGDWCVFSGSGMEDIMVEPVISYFTDRILESVKVRDMHSAACFTGTISHYIQDNSVPVHVINNMLMNHLFPEKNGKYIHYHRIVDGLPFNSEKCAITPRLLGTTRDEMVFHTIQGIKHNREKAMSLLVPLINAIDTENKAEQLRISQIYNSAALELTVSFWHSIYKLVHNDFSESEAAKLQKLQLSRMVPVYEIAPIFDRENFRKFGIDFYPTFYKQSDPDRSYISIDPYRFEPALNKVYGKDGKILPILLRNGDKVEEHRDCIAVSGYGLSVFDTPGKIYHKLTAVTGFHPISQTGNAVRFSVLLDCESGLQLAFQEDKKEGDCSSNLNILLPKDCRRVFFIVTGGNACTSALWCDAVIEK